MDNAKPWYLSKTIWGGVIALLAALLQATGQQGSPLAEGDLAEAATTLAGAVGGVLSVYGRLAAKTSITSN
ncbi:hypothetical protein KLP42_01655 [Rhizobium sp. CSW-27]|nr:hypothetical protein [Rhizobium sp. CSW-27]